MHRAAASARSKKDQREYDMLLVLTIYDLVVRDVESNSFDGLDCEFDLICIYIG